MLLQMILDRPHRGQGRRGIEPRSTSLLSVNDIGSAVIRNRLVDEIPILRLEFAVVVKLAQARKAQRIRDAIEFIFEPKHHRVISRHVTFFAPFHVYPDRVAHTVLRRLCNGNGQE